jgi:hypothetical protein
MGSPIANLPTFRFSYAPPRRVKQDQERDRADPRTDPYNIALHFLLAVRKKFGDNPAFNIELTLAD